MAPVPEKPLHGCLAKNHLVLFLQAILSQQIKWDHNSDELMSAPTGASHKELHESLKYGLNFHVLSYSALLYDPEGVKALSLSDNLDAARARADAETDIMNLVLAVMPKIQASPSVSHAEQVPPRGP